MVQWLVYSAGFFGLFLVNNTLLTMLLFRYDPSTDTELPLLIPSIFVGIAIFVTRCGGALTQPFVGYLSDRVQSRWGRRRPFLAASALPLASSFVMLFVPPHLSHPATYTAYLVALLCLFFLMVAAYQVPYLAWLPEIAPTSEQRIRLSTLLALASLLGTASGGIGAPWLTDRYGFLPMALVLGATGLIALMLPVTLNEDSAKKQSQPSITSFWDSVRTGWCNFPFRIYLAGIMSAWIAVSMLTVCSTFLAVALLHQKIGFGAVINGLVLVGATGGFTLVRPLVKQCGKRRTFQLSMMWSGGGMVAIALLPFLTGAALLPWLSLLAIASVGLAGFFILPNAMLPDAVRHGSALQADGQGALYFGLRGLLVEASIGLGALLSGLLLILGKTPAQPWGLHLALIAAGGFSLLSAWTFSFYSIRE
ncbi:MAG: MFS transporter [Cyanobacteria bacterium P01_D01_bin.123]